MIDISLSDINNDSASNDMFVSSDIDIYHNKSCVIQNDDLDFSFNDTGLQNCSLHGSDDSSNNDNVINECNIPCFNATESVSFCDVQQAKDVSHSSNNLCKIQASNRSYELCSLVGDFNIHIDWVNEVQVTKGALPKILLDTMYSSGFTQVLKEPTYRTLNGDDHFLDLVFVSDPSFVILCNSTYNLNGCDHSAVSLLLNTCYIKGDPIITKPVYCLNRADFDKMKCFLVNGIEKLCIDNNVDIDVIWNGLESVIKDSIDNSVPKKNVSKFKSLPWMTRDIRKMCTKKKLL